MRLRMTVVAMAVFTTSVVLLVPSSAHPGNLMEEDAYSRAAARTIVRHAIAAIGGDALEARASAAVTVPTEGPAPCLNGLAAGTYPCDGIDMFSRLSLADLGLTFGNDIWGWTDPETGRDYALMGGSEGVAIVDISSPTKPDVVGFLPTFTTAGGDFWRDIKVYKNHMYVGSENTGHGIQVFDLTQVRGVTGAPVTFTETGHYARLSNSHNLHINEETGFLYALGATGQLPGVSTNVLTVDEPSSAAGTYNMTGANFGPTFPVGGLSGDIVLVDDGVSGDGDPPGTPTDGCEPFSVPAGAIALVDRGFCGFVIKAANAQAAGASAMVVANNSAGAPITLGGSDPEITIPSGMISLADGNTIKAGLPASGTVSPNPAGNPCLGGGLHMIDISNPASPEFAGCFAEHAYIHDTQCVVYSGPDADHRGSEICFNSAATTSAPGGIHTLSIVDVSDKENPVALAREDYPNPGYSHQGWLTPDSRFFLHGDELDETTHGIGTTTRVWDVRDLDNPVLANTFENETTSIDHNMYTEGKVSYHSNYTSGLRIYDNRNLPALTESGFFDLYPENDNASFEGGTWSNYPYFARSRVVAVSSIDRGLFILRARP
jgi:hypothetical protein